VERIALRAGMRLPRGLQGIAAAVHTAGGSAPACVGRLQALIRAGGPAGETEAAVLELSAGTHTVALLLVDEAEAGAVPMTAIAAAAALPDPFPPPFYPATFGARDSETAGSWSGTYGSAGYVLGRAIIRDCHPRDRAASLIGYTTMAMSSRSSNCSRPVLSLSALTAPS
jgi:hypothetical protein